MTARTITHILACALVRRQTMPIHHWLAGKLIPLDQVVLFIQWQPRNCCVERRLVRLLFIAPLNIGVLIKEGITKSDRFVAILLINGSFKTQRTAMTHLAAHIVDQKVSDRDKEKIVYAL